MQLSNVIDLGGPVALPATLDPNVRQDSLVYPEQLNQLTAQSRTLYRPQIWRSVIEVESVNAWTEQVEDRKWDAHVEEPVNMTRRAPTAELPMPNLSTSREFHKLFDFGLAYGVYDRDLVVAQKLGVNLANEDLLAVNTKIETFLENTAAKGHTATGMVGFGNLADTTAVSKGSQGSGTTWTTATTDEIVADLHSVCNAVEVESKQNARCTRLVVSLERSFRLFQIRSDSLERSPWEIFKAIRPGVELVVWDLMKDQGAGGTQPLIGYDHRWEYAPRMLMRAEAHSLPAMRGVNGYVIPMMFSTGGVRCKAPQVVCKMSGI